MNFEVVASMDFEVVASMDFEVVASMEFSSNKSIVESQTGLCKSTERRV